MCSNLVLFIIKNFNTHVHLNKDVHVMRLRLVTHDVFHQLFGGEASLDFIWVRPFTAYVAFELPELIHKSTDHLTCRCCQGRSEQNQEGTNG